MQLVPQYLFSATPILGLNCGFLSRFSRFEQEFRSFYATPGSVCRKPDGSRGNFGKNRRQQAKNAVFVQTLFYRGRKIGQYAIAFTWDQCARETFGFIAKVGAG